MPRQKSTHVDSPAAVGERLKVARERAGLSQRQLSFPGCSPAYISRIESGDRIPSLQLLRELGRRLGVSEDYLATGADVPSGTEAAVLVEAEVALRLERARRGGAALLDRFSGYARRRCQRRRRSPASGQVAFRRGKPREAFQLFEGALSRLSARTRRAIRTSPTASGRAYAMVGELESAIGVFERSRESRPRRGRSIQTMQFAVLLAHALIDSGNLGRAEELLGARARARETASRARRVRAQLYWSQSRLHAERNDPDTAADIARRALEILLLTEDTLPHRARPPAARPHRARPGKRAGGARPARGGLAAPRGERQQPRAGAVPARGSASARQARAERRGGCARDADLRADRGRASRGRRAELHGSRQGSTTSSATAAGRARSTSSPPSCSSRATRTASSIDVYSQLADLAEAEGRKEEAYELMKKAVGMQQAVAEAAPS